MAFRNAVRYLGLMMMLFGYISSAAVKITDPGSQAAKLAKSNFPFFLKAMDVHLSPMDYEKVVQATGCFCAAFSLFILLGVGRSFFSFLLGVATLAITVCYNVNLDHPAQMETEVVQKVIVDLAIAGGLFFVAGSGRRSGRYSAAREQAVEGHKHH